MKLRLLLTAAVSALPLCACAVGPNYRVPATPATAAGAFVSAEPRISAPDATRADWWRLLRLPPSTSWCRRRWSTTPT